MATIIALASGKGGVGKTLLTAALSLALHRQGKKVLAADADMGLRNLDLMFGMQDEVLWDGGDSIKQRCRFREAVLEVLPGLDFLPASQRHTWEKLDAPAFQYGIEKLARAYDYVVVDCPPGRGYAYKAATAIADRLLLVVAPTRTSVRDIVQRPASRVASVVRGNGNVPTEPQFVNVAKDADILEGDTLVTSGFGSIYPKGLPVGTIVSIHQDATDFVKYAVIRPAVDFSKLEEVFVVAAAVPTEPYSTPDVQPKLVPQTNRDKVEGVKGAAAL